MTDDENTPLGESAVQSAFYVQGTGWLPPEYISDLSTTPPDPSYTAQETPSSDLREDGYAVAVWSGYHTITAANVIFAARRNSNVARAAWFNGTNWESTVTLGIAAQSSSVSNASVVIDLNGNATAVWLGPPPRYDVLASSRPIITGIWTAPQVISTPGLVSSFITYHPEPLAVNPEGDVIATWYDYSLTLDGYLLKAAVKPFGKAWKPAVTFNSANTAYYLNAGIASCGFEMHLWLDSPSFGPGPNNTIQATVNYENLIFPADLLVTQCCKGRNCANVLRWTSDSCALSYNLYCNGILIATVLNTGVGTLQFLDGSVCRDCVYTLSSVNIYGIEGGQIPFTF